MLGAVASLSTSLPSVQKPSEGAAQRLLCETEPVPEQRSRGDSEEQEK